jgi:hypothetical protein
MRLKDDEMAVQGVSPVPPFLEFDRLLQAGESGRPLFL